jgi:hypothetical protein
MKGRVVHLDDTGVNVKDVEYLLGALDDAMYVPSLISIPSCSFRASFSDFCCSAPLFGTLLGYGMGIS